MSHRLTITLLAATAALILGARRAYAELTPVDDTDPIALETSASIAFQKYLDTIDKRELVEASEQVLDPGTMDGRDAVLDRLVKFMRGRQKNPVRNEAMIIRMAGDWALVVYQYDTTVDGKTARVITTAWMIQWEGFWRQYIVAPEDSSFWDDRRSDYETLLNWFDTHAEEIAAAA